HRELPKLSTFLGDIDSNTCVSVVGRLCGKAGLVHPNYNMIAPTVIPTSPTSNFKLKGKDNSKLNLCRLQWCAPTPTDTLYKLVTDSQGTLINLREELRTKWFTYH